MKAFLLAAGLGTRLRPLTDSTPKCMVLIDGKPLLEYWFMLFQQHGIGEFLINTHHLPDQVRNFVALKAPEYGLRGTVVHEQVLLGSAGTLRTNFEFVRGEREFLVLYADNLTDADLGALVRFHEARQPILTMALFHMDRPETRGIAEVAESGWITSFVEKPKQPKSDLANGGLYVVSSDIEPYLEDAFDIGYDVLPKLAGAMCGVEMECYHRDIGTLEALEAANAEWAGIGK